MRRRNPQKNRKFDRLELAKMLRNGASISECAEHFGVSPSAISQAKRELNVAVVRCVAMENGHRVMDMHLDVMGQMRKINADAVELLDKCMEAIRGEGSMDLKRRFKSADPHELAFKGMAEVRGQIKLYHELVQSLYNVQEMAAFQEEVLNIIGEFDEEKRRRLEQRLIERAALRRAFKQD